MKRIFISAALLSLLAIPAQAIEQDGAVLGYGFCADEIGSPMAKHHASIPQIWIKVLKDCATQHKIARDRPTFASNARELEASFIALGAKPRRAARKANGDEWDDTATGR